MRLSGLAMVLVLAMTAVAAEERLLYEVDSLYHHIIVSESSEVRVLRFHRGPAQAALDSDFAQSLISLSDPYSLRMGYAKHAMAATGLLNSPKRALFVGLGAGTLPKFFARAFPECQVDVAELDAKVVEVAHKYFFLPEMPNLHITVMDGRQFVKKSKEKYDLVVLDAYRDDMIPFHLLTRDFLDELKEKLADNAVVVSNIAIQGDRQLYPWVLQTYQSAFATVMEANVPGTINKVLVARTAASAVTSADLAAGAKALASRITFDYDLAACAAAYRDASSKKVIKNILTDDYAPVNLMRLRKADEKDWEY